MRRLLFTARAALISPARTTRRAVVFGRLLGAAFLICFATGLISHFIQHPVGWLDFPAQPYWFFQFTQGLHVATGTLCIPLLLAKLWTVYPNLFSWPPFDSPLRFLERASIALFVGTSLVQLAIGVLNIFQFLPLPFYFLQVHYALSYVVIGLLATHIGAKLPAIVRHWRRGGGEGELEAYENHDDPEASGLPPAGPERQPATAGVTGRVLRWIDATPDAPAPVSRRTVLTGVGLSAVALLVTTVGQSWRPLSFANVFAPREKGVGPQGVPINRTAAQAGVRESAADPSWVLTLVAGDRTIELTRDQLLAMPQTEADLPIACVEGWSQMASWRGVRLRDLLSEVGAGEGVEVRFTSLEEQGPYKSTLMQPHYVDEPTTLVALELNGEPLDIEHGYPARLISPGRPGVLQTKWLSRVEVV